MTSNQALASWVEEMAQLSQQHGMEMHQQQDAPHLEAMQKMQELMQDQEKMQEWFVSKKAEFDALPEE